MISQKRFLMLVRASAIYDILATAPFLTPWSFSLLIEILRAAHSGLGLPGQIPDFEPTHVLLANLLGAVVLVWSVARLHLGMPLLGRYDAVARALFAVLQAYAVTMGASPILLLFTAAEVVFGVAQCLPYREALAGEPGEPAAV